MHKGIAVSPGVVVGVAYRVDSVFGSSDPQTLPDPTLIDAEIDRFDRAVALSAAELEVIVTKVAQQLGNSEAEIFKSHLQIINDQTLLSKVRSLIQAQQLTALFGNKAGLGVAGITYDLLEAGTVKLAV